MLLKRLQMKKEELFAFAELLSENNPEEKTSSLLNIIGEQSKENLFTALAAYQKKEKSKLDTEDEHLFIAALYRKSNINNIIYLLPATNWKHDNPPFRIKNYDKPGLVSKPEYGINFSQKTLELIENYRLKIIVSKLIGSK